MTAKKWEGSKADKKLDKKMGYKEGSKKDMAIDKKMMAKSKGQKYGAFAQHS